VPQTMRMLCWASMQLCCCVSARRMVTRPHHTAHTWLTCPGVCEPWLWLALVQEVNDVPFQVWSPWALLPCWWCYTGASARRTSMPLAIVHCCTCNTPMSMISSDDYRKEGTAKTCKRGACKHLFIQRDWVRTSMPLLGLVAWGALRSAFTRSSANQPLSVWLTNSWILLPQLCLRCIDEP
jgi:hypothetical protein